jgi:hypothetical protein
MMSVLQSDTHPKIEALQLQLLRKSSPARKLELLAGLNASAHLLALSGLRSRFPADSEQKLQRRLAGLLIGEDLACKVYGKIDNAA